MVKRVLPLLIVLPAWAAAAELSYTFRVTNGPALAAEVSFAVTAAGPARLILPNSYGGAEELWKHIADLRVVDGPASLQPAEQPFLRKLNITASGRVRLRYRIVPLDGPLERRAYYRPVVGADYMHLLGNAMIVRPDWGDGKTADVEMNWTLPRGWKFASSFGANETRQQFRAATVDLLRAVYVAGDFRVLQTPVAGKPLVAAIRGKWGFTDEEFLQLAARIIQRQRSFWRDEDFPFFLITLLPVDVPRGSISGTGRTNGFSCFLAAGAPLDQRLKHLLSHELLHTWIPFKLAGSRGVRPPLYWFSEGVTEYYAWVFLAIDGLVTFEEFVETINRKLYSYHASSARNAPNEEVAQKFFAAGPFGDMAYLRGTLLALNWNAQARARSRGKRSLNDVMAGLWAARDTPFTMDRLAAEASRAGVPNAAERLKRWIEAGETITIRPDALGPCAEFQTEARIRGDDEIELPVFYVKRNDATCLEWFQ